MNMRTDQLCVRIQAEDELSASYESDIWPREYEPPCVGGCSMNIETVRDAHFSFITKFSKNVFLRQLCIAVLTKGYAIASKTIVI